MMFDVTKARKVAEAFMEFLEPEDKDFLRVGMTIRAACNEVERLRAGEAALLAAKAAFDDGVERAAKIICELEALREVERYASETMDPNVRLPAYETACHCLINALAAVDALRKETNK